MGKSFGIVYELMCFYMYVRLPLRDGAIDMYEFSALWKYVQEWKGCFDRYTMYTCIYLYIIYQYLSADWHTLGL